MLTLLEKVESGESLSEEEWKIAVTLFRATLVLIEEPPYEAEKEQALQFIALMLKWSVVHARLEKIANELKVFSAPNEDWDAIEDLLAELNSMCDAYCYTLQQDEFDAQIQRKLVESGLVEAGA